MKPIGYLLVFLFCATLARSADSLAHEKENSPFWVHGRLSPWNGNPTFRIWVVGTKRILGVKDSEDAGSDQPSMPKELYNIFLSQPGIFGTEIYADFLVEPLKPDEEGYMRPVKIIEAKKLVVTYDEKITLQKDKIQTEPNQSLQTTTRSSLTSTIFSACDSSQYSVRVVSDL